MDGELKIEKYPLLKLAVPLVVGIIIGWQCNVSMLHVATLFVFSVAAVAVGLFSFAPRWLFGAGAVGAMLAVGLFSINCEKSVAQPRWSGQKVACEARLLEMPYMSGTATRARAFVTACDSAPGARREGVVDIYFANSVEAEALRVGERVRFTAAVENPANSGNPAEFDVVRYMRVKGVSGSLFLPVGGWESAGVEPLGLRERALALRDKVVIMYERLGFEGDNLSMLSAFSVGERRGFSAQLREAYAQAGVSHLLALSGLHLGIFYMVVAGLLSLVGGGYRFLLVRELAALLLLWAFAFVAGLTPSVVRAVVMFTVVSVGRCLRRDGAVLNTLAFAAVAMLVWQPRLLFDVGFQLSFAAVFSIVLFVPVLQRAAHCENHGRLYNFFVSLAAASLAAQVGVLPFVWYYFGTFPLYFLFANMLLVPLASLLMALVVLLLVCTPVPLLQSAVAWLLGLLLSFMNGTVEIVASLPGASLMLPQVGVPGACCIALLVVLVAVAVVARKWWPAVLATVVGGVLLLLGFFLTPEKARDYILVFNNRKAAAVLAVAGEERAYMLSSVPRFDFDGARVVEPFLLREGIEEPRWLENGVCDSVASCKSGLLSFAGLRVQLLADDCWLADSVSRPVDALLLCRGYLGKVSDLLVHYPASCVILDGSLYERSRARLLRECAAAGVGCVDVSTVGAVRLMGGCDTFAVETMRGK